MHYKLVRPRLRRRESSVWYIYWSEHGRSRRRATGCTDLTTAERWLAEYKAEASSPASCVTVNEIIEQQGQKLLGWRVLPTDEDGANIGPSARAARPGIEQLFVAAADGVDRPGGFRPHW